MRYLIAGLMLGIVARRFGLDVAAQRAEARDDTKAVTGAVRAACASRA